MTRRRYSARATGVGEFSLKAPAHEFLAGQLSRDMADAYSITRKPIKARLYLT